MEAQSEVRNKTGSTLRSTTRRKGEILSERTHGRSPRCSPAAGHRAQPQRGDGSVWYSGRGLLGPLMADCQRSRLGDRLGLVPGTLTSGVMPGSMTGIVLALHLRYPKDAGDETNQTQHRLRR